MERNVKLLRPFDLEAVKKGEPFCTNLLMKKQEFIAVDVNSSFNYGSRIIVRISEGPNVGDIGSFNTSEYRMEPITWLDGKPVYSDSELHRTDVIHSSPACSIVNIEEKIKCGMLSWEDPYAELKKAYAEGKTIQIFDLTNTWVDLKHVPKWKSSVDKYRIKPEIDPYAELKKAYDEGKTIEYLDCSGKWRDISPTWNRPAERYRIKQITKQYLKISVEKIMSYNTLDYRDGTFTNLSVDGDYDSYLVEE